LRQRQYLLDYFLFNHLPQPKSLPCLPLHNNYPPLEEPLLRK
jgi:hypothetical protein